MTNLIDKLRAAEGGCDLIDRILELDDPKIAFLALMDKQYSLGFGAGWNAGLSCEAHSDKPSVASWRKSEATHQRMVQKLETNERRYDTARVALLTALNQVEERDG